MLCVNIRLFVIGLVVGFISSTTQSVNIHLRFDIDFVDPKFVIDSAKILKTVDLVDLEDLPHPLLPAQVLSAEGLADFRF